MDAFFFQRNNRDLPSVAEPVVARTLTGALLLSAGLLLLPAQSANAACVVTPTQACLADQPIQSASNVKPNVLFVIDNSGSMVWDIMSVDSGLSENQHRGDRCRKNHQYNTVYYNPNINYTAAVPKNASNVSMGSQSFTNAQTDPYLSPGTRVNLSTSFCAVSARCSAGDANPDLRPQAAYYYKWVGPGTPGANCDTHNDDAHYVKVPVSATSCVVGGDVTKCGTGSADERENFANWYSYNRTRILMMKSGMSSAFSTIDDKMRVGFHTINNPSSGNSSGRSLNIDDFAATQKNNWYTALWSLAPSGGTPLRAALARAGNYYSNSGTMTGLSGDPVQYSCQKNYTILSTDGYWNGSAPGVGDKDATVPSSMPIRAGASSYVIADTGLTPGAAFPRPYYQGATVASDTLADVAMHYWVRDLRTSGSVSANNVKTTPSDPAYWQHMNTFTVGLGVNGTLVAPNPDEPGSPDDVANLLSGAKNWPVPVADTVTAVDDLWHAAVNGRGQYYRATNPTNLSNSLTAALRAVGGDPTYGVGPSSSTNDFKSPNQSDYTTYVTSYKVIDWSGDVNKYDVNRATGQKTGSPLWSASYQLDSKVNPGLTPTVDPNAFKTRRIVTRNGSTTVEFSYATLSAAQQTALCYKAPPGTGPCVGGDTSLVDYLRGDATYEGVYGTSKLVGATTTLTRYRDRHDPGVTAYHKRNLLGSVVNSQPAYVGEEQRIYLEATDPGYSAFKTASASRAKVLYVGANDGMVHAFDSATGNELWAYVPSMLIPQANDEAGKEKGLRALSYQDGGAPAYTQHFYVDGPQEVGAVDFARTGGPIIATSPSGNWRNVLVGGLGKGGKGYYALDVTTPANSLSAAKAAVLWEFPSAADPSHAAVISGNKMGYSYGRPIIAKTYNYGWSVLLPSGYNNDGNGYVFVLNAMTGELLETLQTTAAAPGLAHITMLASPKNKYVMQVYGGDLNGNLWRFDFGYPALATRVAQIYSSSSSTPIASEPNVSVDGNSGNRWVFFGTGRYLDVIDRATTGNQYLVALRDGSAGVPLTGGAVTALSSLTSVSDTLTGLAAEPPLGWKYLLPSSSSGERMVLKPVADLRTVVFGTLIPTTDPCSPGVSGVAYGLEYSTGASRLLNSTGSVMANMPMPKGVSGISIQLTGKTAGSTGTPQASICDYEGNCVAVKLDLRKLFAGTRHVGWRELLQEY